MALYLFQSVRILQDGKLGTIELIDNNETEVIHPHAVLALQESLADVAFTLDFPIPYEC